MDCLVGDTEAVATRKVVACRSNVSRLFLLVEVATRTSALEATFKRLAKQVVDANLPYRLWSVSISVVQQF